MAYNDGYRPVGDAGAISSARLRRTSPSVSGSHSVRYAISQGGLKPPRSTWRITPHRARPAAIFAFVNIERAPRSFPRRITKKWAGAKPARFKSDNYPAKVI